MYEVLENTFQRWNIENETVIIKSYNASNQYKNKYAFQSTLNLCNKYNVKIVTIYEAASHGKGLIDAKFSFGFKSNLRRDIVTDDFWIQNSSEICEYLSSRCDSRMLILTVNLNARKIDEKRSNKGFKIKECMTQRISEYLPRSKTVYNREYLRKCEDYNNLSFSPCLEESKGVDLDETNKEVAITGNAEPKSKTTVN